MVMVIQPFAQPKNTDWIYYIIRKYQVLWVLNCKKKSYISGLTEGLVCVIVVVHESTQLKNKKKKKTAIIIIVVITIIINHLRICFPGKFQLKLKAD